MTTKGVPFRKNVEDPTTTPAPKRRPPRFCYCGQELVPYNPGPNCYVHTPIKTKIADELNGLKRSKGSPE